MPPFINRKRRETSPEPEPPPKKKKTSEPAPTKDANLPEKTNKRKPKPPKVRAVATKIEKKRSVFDAVDNTSRGQGKADGSILFGKSDDDESDLTSEADSDEFEDAIPEASSKAAQLSDEEEEEEWEDALHNPELPEAVDGAPDGVLELTLGGPRAAEETYADLTDKKQGPSKKDKQTRVLAHCIHVQYLMWHNHTRNHWLNDSEVQKIVVGHMHQSQKMKVQYESWRKRSGMTQEPESKLSTPNAAKSSGKSRDKAKGRRSGKGNARSERDWGTPAERQAVGEPDMSRGDPLQQFLGALATWWKQRFTITAPVLRKRGYKPVKALKDELTAWRKGESDIEDHGERIASLKEFRAHAKTCEGSRDVGAQLFVALLRGLGIEARMVRSLQPLGYGWTKVENAESKPRKCAMASEQNIRSQTSTKSKRKPNLSKPDVVSLSDTSDLSELPDAKDEDEESDVSIIDITPKKRPNMPFDRDLVFPSTWIEAISSLTHKVFPVDPFLIQPSVVTGPDQLALFEARGAKAEKARQVFAYVVAFSPDNTAKDVTVRYLRKHVWPGKTKGFRLPSARIPVHNRHGRVRGYYDVDWWQTVMQPYLRPALKRTIADDIEDQSDLKVVEPEKKAPKAGVPDTLDGFKRSTEYVLARHLRREEALLPAAETVQVFKTGKGSKATEEPVYRRKDVVTCRTSESWHKEGRQVKLGQQPLKMVAIRAVTMTRKREIEETERETGEKAMQGMYGKDQTEWIVPPPIQNGVIPKNSYGNMDAFVPQMIPKGAVHIPLRGTVKVCKKLDIDYAEAVTGFEFGNKMAVPVIEGVVVAKENENRVIDAWEKAEEERQAREAVKQEKLVLGTWRKFLMGLRIMERMRDEYEVNVNDKERETNPFVNPNRQAKSATSKETRTQQPPDQARVDQRDDYDLSGGFLAEDEAETGGGFLPEGQEVEILPERRAADQDHSGMNGGFLLEADEQTQVRPTVKRGPIRSLAELAAQRLQDEGEHSEKLDDDSQDDSEERPAKRKVKGRAAAATQKPKPRAQAKRTPQRRGRAAKSQLDGGDDSTEPAEDSLSELSSTDSSPPLPVPSSRAERANARSAAKLSQDKTRSRFFDSITDGSDE